jgi:hypothetical protein
MSCVSCATQNVTKDPYLDCDSSYLELIKKVDASSDIPDAKKDNYVSQLEKALQYCKTGDKEAASKIMFNLRSDAVFEKVSDTEYGH